MVNSLTLNVVTPNEGLFKGNVRHLSVKGSEGELGIYPGHTALITAIKPCMLKFVDEQQQENVMYVAGGFMEVQPSQVNIMADVAERADDIDMAEAQKAQDAAHTRLQNCDVKRFLALELELMKANAKLQVAKHHSQFK